VKYSRFNEVDSRGNPIVSDQKVEIIKKELLLAAGLLENVDPQMVAVATSLEKNEKGKYELSVLLLAKDRQSDGSLAANPDKVISEVQTVLETIPPLQVSN
jgi:hypothetical protein